MNRAYLDYRRYPPKKLLFELTGQEDLIQSGYAGLFEESKTLPHYSEVHASWLETLETLNFGTPKISVSSVAEQRQTEQFFLELRHGDRAAAFRTHDIAENPLRPAVGKNPVGLCVPLLG